jgi:hypothetical protein
MNCWESKKCGRQPGGAKAEQLGVCPAATEKRLHGSNHGTNGGRACWIVAGTLCGGKVQGTFAAKMASCMDCEFYLGVRQEEGKDFADPRSLLLQVRN